MERRQDVKSGETEKRREEQVEEEKRRIVHIYLPHLFFSLTESL